MTHSIGGKAANYLLALLAFLGGWYLLSVFYPPAIVPPMTAVASQLADIFTSAASWATIRSTAALLLAGLGLGVFAGSVLGLVLGYNRRLREICRPLLGLIQTVPPVSWLVLALIWFGFDGRPSLFMVALSSLPVITVNLTAGIRAIDPKLLEMAAIYRFSAWKKLRRVIIPSVMPSFRSGLHIAIGLGTKGVVMGEILTTNTGVGGAIGYARENFEPEGVIAWTLVMVLMYYLLDNAAAFALRVRGERRC